MSKSINKYTQAPRREGGIGWLVGSFIHSFCKTYCKIWFQSYLAFLGKHHLSPPSVHVRSCTGQNHHHARPDQQEQTERSASQRLWHHFLCQGLHPGNDGLLDLWKHWRSPCRGWVCCLMDALLLLIFLKLYPSLVALPKALVLHAKNKLGLNLRFMYCL